MRPKKRVVEAPTPAQPVEAEVQAAPAAPEAPAVPAVEVAAPLLTPPPTAVFSPLLPDDDDGSVEQALDDVADAEVVESQEEEPRPAPRRYGLRYLPGRPPR